MNLRLALTFLTLSVVLVACPSETVKFASDERIVRGEWSGEARRPCDVGGFAWSPDGSRIVSGGRRPVVWNATNAEIVSRLRVDAAGMIWDLRWSADGTSVIGMASTYTTNGLVVTVKTWSATDGKVLGSTTLAADNPRSVSLSPDGSRVAIADSFSPTMTARVRVVKLADSSETLLDWSVPGTNVMPQELVWSADGSRLMGSAVTYGSLQPQTTPAPPPGAVRIWDALNTKVIRTFGPVQGGLLAFTISPDGRWLVRRDQPELTLINLETDTERVLGPNGGFASNVTFSADNKKLLANSVDRLTEYDVATAQAREVRLASPTNENPPGGLMQLRDGLILAFWSRNVIDAYIQECGIRLYRLEDGSVVRTFDDTQNSKLGLRLSLRATYVNEREYAIAGSAIVGGVSFTVRGQGQAGGAQRFVPQTALPLPMSASLELLDNAGKVVWKVGGPSNYYGPFLSINQNANGVSTLTGSLVDATLEVAPGVVNSDDGFQFALTRVQ